MKFPQKVRFIGELIIDTEGMDWTLAAENVSQALLDGDGGEVNYTLSLVKVICMEIVEDGA